MSGSFRVTTDRDGGRSFGGRNEHDDRAYYGPSNRRRKSNRRGGGSWNRGRNDYSNGGRGGRGGGPNPRSRLDNDGDIDMDGNGPSSGPQRRFDPYDSRRRRGGSNRDRSRGGGGGRNLAMDRNNDGGAVASRLGLPVNRNSNRSLNRSDRNNRSLSGGLQWYKVKVHHGAKYDKDFILKSMTDYSDIPFVPQQYQLENDHSIFYVQNQVAADAINRLTNKIKSPSGFMLRFTVNKSAQPVKAMDAASLEKLKTAMNARYDPGTKALNLSNLYNDAELTRHGLHMAISRATIMSQIIKVITDNIPELVRLDLSNNKLYSLEQLGDLVPKTPNMIELNLSRNQIKSDAELEKIGNWKLEVLWLDKNPVCDNFKDETSYVSAVRRKFPKVIQLDGHTLPPPIIFDIDTTTSLPPSQGSFFMDDQVKGLLVTFLEQYFAIYDSNNRQSLLDAYHDQAVFSLCTHYNKNLTNKQQNFSEYIPLSRNLLKVVNTEKRQKTMKVGKLDVVALLNQLPKTQHIPSSFVVDVNHKSSAFLVFTLSGLFKEVGQKGAKVPVWWFSRVFITIPQGSGIVILNEQYSMTAASYEQAQKFENPAPTPSSSPVPGTSGAVTLAQPTLGTPAVTEEIQKEMMKQFSQQSGMNADWSMKCLAQNDWDYNKAAQVFTDLNSKGSIPPDAFVK